jgi:2,4-dienoyl-CoA reductase-like NADH-dependent reductase (Old Yellow Enzyme family)
LASRTSRQSPSGGAGLIIQEATSVSQKAFSGDLGLWKDEQIEKMQQINRFIIGQNSVPGIQLAHGRKASAAIPWEGGKKILLMGLGTSAKRNWIS